jgi:glycosyltransferase involved in cell wall biosynthesis
MRIALVSTPFIPVPPVGYGGTELVVAELALALARKGHEVVVYATGDSDLPGIEIRSYFATPHWPPEPQIDATHAAYCLRDIARDPKGFDVVHAHSCAAVELSRLCPYPIVATVHHERTDELTRVYRENPHVRLVAVSANQARKEKAPVSAIVHHGLSPERFRQLPDQGYLLFVGRFSRVKGTHLAIEIAARARLPLVLAGRPHEDDYYEQEVEPRIKRYGVLDIGPVHGARKAAIIARARALVFPIDWEEPFGLVMIEALLSGVPVLALRRGSVPEIIEDGVTGLIGDDATELVAGARIAEKFFDRGRIAQIGQKRWSADRMADDYLQVYRDAAAERIAGAGGAWQIGH